MSLQRLKETMNDSSSVISKQSGVQSKVDTRAKLESKKLSPGEMFMRIKPLTLAGLIQENEVAESVFGLVDDDQNSDVRSCAPSAVPTIAGSFVSVVAADADMGEDGKGYVVYDLREADEYTSQHIISALSYPATLLNSDKISRELHQLKSSPKKLIVYHTNEALGAAVAMQLVHKGWENTCLLSGGFKEFAERFPELMEDGEMLDRSKTNASVATARSRRPPRVPHRRPSQRVSSLQRLPPSP
jgi:rhodanese-related sulfurtransferase